MLGGHMKCQMAKNLLEGEQPLAIDNSSKKERRVGYSLRENPKKSWKLLRLEENAQENACPVSDNQSRSMRPMFCHMNIHSTKDYEHGARREDRGKGSRLVKSCRDHKMLIHDRESLFNEGRFVGSSKTKSDLLLIVLSEDEMMRVTRRKRTPRYEVDKRTEGVLLSRPNGSSNSSEAEGDPEKVATVTLMMMIRGETDYTPSRLGVQPFQKSSALDFFDGGKGRITKASKCNENHSRGYSRMEQKGIEFKVPASKVCRAGEVEQKKPKQARSGKDPLYEAAMMDRDAMGTTGSIFGKSAELCLEPALNSYTDNVRAAESQVVQEPVEENKHKSKNAENYKQEAPVNASDGIAGTCGCTELKSIKHDSEKMNSDVCSISCAGSDDGDAANISV